MRVAAKTLVAGVLAAGLSVSATASATAWSQGQPSAGSRTVPDRAAKTLTPLPVGVTLPIAIHQTYRAGKTRVGTTIVASTTQRVPLGNHRYLRYGTKVIGTVVASDARDSVSGRAAMVVIRFNQLMDGRQTLPIRTAAVAIANFTDVADTDIPANANLGRGTASIASMTTHQIGEDEVSRSGWDGEVVDGRLNRVGFADHYGVYADPPANAAGAAAIPRALGVFSTTAKGLYGFDDGAEMHSAAGAMTITSPNKLILRNGDNLLLQVIGTP